MSDKSSAFGSRHDLSRVETPLPDWVIVGESVLVRPYSYSGVIAYVGPTEFASGTWIGVELDAPTGKPRFPHTCLSSLGGKLCSWYRSFFQRSLQVKTMVLWMAIGTSRVDRSAGSSSRWTNWFKTNVAEHLETTPSLPLHLHRCVEASAEVSITRIINYSFLRSCYGRTKRQTVFAPCNKKPSTNANMI